MTSLPACATRSRGVRRFAIGLALVALPASQTEAASQTFDGTWAVALDCPDTQDRNGPVKGYAYRFDVSISDGALTGTYGKPGAPATVAYAGHVIDDGTIDIVATGNTGRSDFSVGHVAEGSRYGYTLHGKLTANEGVASRHEVRPCTATFARR